MNNELSEFVKPNADYKYVKHPGVTFENIKKKLANLAITDQLGWITVYKSMIPEDLSKLTKYYATRLEKHLSIYSISNMYSEFNTTWQYYQPFNHIPIQKIISDHINSNIGEDHCKDMLKYLPKILIGTQITSNHAKNLLYSVINCLIQTYSNDMRLTSTLDELFISKYTKDDKYGYVNAIQVHTTEMILEGIKQSP